MDHIGNTPQEHQPSEAFEPNASAVKTLTKEEHQRLFQNGMRWLAVGAFLLVSSFGINYLLFDTDTSFIAIMYVMTSLGVLCIMKCLANILGF